MREQLDLALKKIEKNREKNFFFDFPKFFSVEIFHMMSRLRMQSFNIIGQVVPEISVRTHRQIILVI